MHSGVGPALAGGSGVSGGALAGGSGVTPSSPPAGDIMFLGAGAIANYTGVSSFAVPMVPCAVGDLRIIHIAGNYPGSAPTFTATGWTSLVRDLGAVMATDVLYRFKRAGDDDGDVTVAAAGGSNPFGVRSIAYSGVASIGGTIVGYASPAASIDPGAVTATGADSWIAYLGLSYTVAEWQDPQTGYVIDSIANGASPNTGFMAAHIAPGAAGPVDGGPLTMATSFYAVLVGFELVAGTFNPVDAGETLLRSFPLWLDISDYDGSGTITNKGTVGAALDATASGGALAAGALALNGSSNYVEVPSDPSIDLGAGESLTFGIVLISTGQQSYGAFGGKRGAAKGYYMLSNDTANQTYAGFVVGGVVNSAGWGGGINVITFQRNGANGNISSGVNNAGTPQGDSAAGDQTNTGPLAIGCVNPGVRSNFQSFKLLGAFVVKANLTDADVAAIAAHYA